MVFIGLNYGGKMCLNNINNQFPSWYVGADLAFLEYGSFALEVSYGIIL